jgi:glycosyltransferase involved in cell wall biosynthesis
MKVIHVPFCFAPDPFGGTEVYVANLARDLQGLGVNAMVAAPSETSRSYTIDGLQVRRYAVSDKVTDIVQLYGPGDLLAATEFAKILDEEMPDLVHLHAFTRGVSLRLVHAAKKRGIPVVFTYHTPTVSCQRGTLLLWGKGFCDGKLDVIRCSGCTLNGLGIYSPLAAQMGRLTPTFGRWLGDRGLQGGVWTALRMSELISVRHAIFRKMASEVDHIVAVCNWVKDVILLNDVPEAKVSLSRHGISWVPDQTAANSPSSTRQSGDTMRLAFVGRMDSTKGLHVLIKAFKMAPTLNARLDVYGVVQSPANAAYQKEMLTLAEGDSRISFLEPIAPQQVVTRLRAYDFLAVPSQWLETGPLVALEAFAAGIPVIGWKLGGINEIVQDGVNGLLIEPDSVERWAETLRRAAEDARLRAQLKAGVRPPRTSVEVAREMLALYQSLLGSQQARQPVHASQSESP